MKPIDLLTFIYTLGTGGPSTLARLTHGDVLARVMALGERLAEIRPEFFAPPPSLWERMRDSVLARFDGHLERAAADRAAALAGIGLDQLQSATVAHSCPPDLVGFWRTLGVPLNIEELCSE